MTEYPATLTIPDAYLVAVAGFLASLLVLSWGWALVRRLIGGLG